MLNTRFGLASSKRLVSCGWFDRSRQENKEEKETKQGRVFEGIQRVGKWSAGTVG